VKEKFSKKWSTPETPKIEAIRAEKARLIEEDKSKPRADRQEG
jgi:hypothetical protein